MIVSKLPPDLRLLGRRISSVDLDMDSLLATFEEELIARERACNSSQSQLHKGSDKPRHNTLVFLMFTQESARVSCCYCQQPHFSADCKTVMSIAAHKQILNTSGRCFNCLRKSNISLNCRSSFRCSKCKRNIILISVKESCLKKTLSIYACTTARNSIFGT